MFVADGRSQVVLNLYFDGEDESTLARSTRHLMYLSVLTHTAFSQAMTASLLVEFALYVFAFAM